MSAVGPSVNTKFIADALDSVAVLAIPPGRLGVSTPEGIPPEVLATRLLLMQGRSSCTQHIKGEKMWEGPR